MSTTAAPARIWPASYAKWPHINHVLGHGTIGADKDREQKIQYNRFITKWRQRLSTTLQRASHSVSSRSHAATTRLADTRTTTTMPAWETSFTS